MPYILQNICWAYRLVLRHVSVTSTGSVLTRASCLLLNLCAGNKRNSVFPCCHYTRPSHDGCRFERLRFFYREVTVSKHRRNTRKYAAKGGSACPRCPTSSLEVASTQRDCPQGTSGNRKGQAPDARGRFRLRK